MARPDDAALVILPPPGRHCWGDQLCAPLDNRGEDGENYENVERRGECPFERNDEDSKIETDGTEDDVSSQSRGQAKGSHMVACTLSIVISPLSLAGI